MIRISGVIGLLLYLVPQAEPVDRVRELISRLSSDDVAVREDAGRLLKALGKAAAPGLKEAARSTDPETAGRAKRLLRALEIHDNLPPGLLKEFPGVEDRLASGAHEWTLLLLQVESGIHKLGAQGSAPVLGRPHLEALATEAVRGAETPTERAAVSRILQGYHLRRAAPALLEWLRSPSSEARVDACSALSNMDCPELAGELIPLVGDSHAGWSAQYAFTLLRPWRLDPKLIAMIRDPDLSNRKIAVQLVGERKLRAAIPDLTELLRDPDPAVRIAALGALQQLKDRPPIALLLRLARDPIEKVRDQVCRFLMAGDEPEVRALALEWIRKPVKHPMHPQLWQAVTAAGRLKMSEAIPDLMKVLEGIQKNEDDRVIEWAAKALSEMGGEEAHAALKSMLLRDDLRFQEHAIEAVLQEDVRSLAAEAEAMANHPKERIRRAAIRAMVQFSGTSAIPRIVPYLKDSEAMVRWGAIHALKSVNAREQCPALLGALKDPDPGVRQAALEVLQELKCADALDRMLELLGDPCLQVSESLVDFGAGSQREGIRALLRDPRPKARFDAVQLLTLLKDRDSISDIRLLLDDPQLEVRAAACVGLARLGGQGWIPVAEKLLESRQVQHLAMEALALGGLPALPALGRLITRSEEQLQGVEAKYQARWLIHALVEAGGKEALPYLMKFLDHPSRPVRTEAQNELLQMNAELLPKIMEVMERRGDAEWADFGGLLAGFGISSPLPDLFRKAVGEHSRSLAFFIQSVALLNARDCLPSIREALQSESALVIESAVEAVGRLGDHDSLPLIRSLLHHTDEGIRHAAARSLCLLGERDGVRILIEEDVSRLFVLNRLRRPEMWKKLSNLRQTATLKGTTRERLARWTVMTGVPVEVPPVPSHSRKEYLNTYNCWLDRKGKASALEGLADDSLVLDFGFILEGDRVRTLPMEEYRRFWRDWWESEGRR